VRIATCLPPRILSDLQLDERYPGAAPGLAVFVRKDKKLRLLCVRCKNGWLAVDHIYYGQKKVMSPIDFYNGFLSKGNGQMFIRDIET
jgi:Formyl transferase, C-terminal domain